jgi:hypothetical protein
MIRLVLLAKQVDTLNDAVLAIGKTLDTVVASRT